MKLVLRIFSILQIGFFIFAIAMGFGVGEVSIAASVFLIPLAGFGLLGSVGLIAGKRWAKKVLIVVWSLFALGLIALAVGGLLSADTHATVYHQRLKSQDC